MSVPSNVIVTGGRVEQAQQHPAERRLPRARLADQPDRLPGSIARSTPSTARTWPTVRRSMPRRIGKCFVTPVPRQAARRRDRSGRRWSRRHWAPSSVSSSTRMQRARWPSATARRARPGRSSHSGDRVRAPRVEPAAGRASRWAVARRRGSTPAARRPRPPAGSPRAGPGVRVLRAREQRRRPTPPRRPGPRTSPTTRSQRSATTPRSWVTKITAMPVRACSVRSRSRICACTVTSSAVVGSSAMSSRGSHDERHRDHRPLAHAARELVRVVARGGARGSGMPTSVEQLDRACARAATCSSCGAAGSCRRAASRW